MPNVFLFVKNLRHVKEVVMLLRACARRHISSTSQLFRVLQRYYSPVSDKHQWRKRRSLPANSKWRRHKQQPELLQLIFGFIMRLRQANYPNYEINQRALLAPLPDRLDCRFQPVSWVHWYVQYRNQVCPRVSSNFPNPACWIRNWRSNVLCEEEQDQSLLDHSWMWQWSVDAWRHRANHPS